MTAVWFTLLVAALLMVCAYIDQQDSEEGDPEPLTVEEEGGE